MLWLHRFGLRGKVTGDRKTRGVDCIDGTIMKAKQKTLKTRRAGSQVFFILFKLPALLITPILGFIIEFLYELPFMLVCLLDRRSRK